MAPNKSWMTLSSIDRLSDEYNEGIKDFLSFAFDRLGEATQVIKYVATPVSIQEMWLKHIL